MRTGLPGGGGCRAAGAGPGWGRHRRGADVPPRCGAVLSLARHGSTPGTQRTGTSRRQSTKTPGTNPSDLGIRDETAGHGNSAA
ncbi:hypothetical protein FM106_16130 [Brachybacterium faecium]|nr:hypothetical protein FM106_16130 [Brachybacterium faecium]